MKKLSILLCVFTMLIAVPLQCFAAADAPALKSIEFNNAALDTTFRSDALEYTITLTNNTEAPTLKSYQLAEDAGDCELLVTYTLDDIGHQTGVKVTLSTATGSGVSYVFSYSNPAEYEENSNNSLSYFSCNLGELDKELNDTDTTYKLYIPKDLDEVVISVVADNIYAKTEYVESWTNKGKNFNIPVKCIATDGSEKLYTFKVRRINKTVAQVEAERSQEGFVSFVDGTHFYQNTMFYVIAGAVAGGALVLYLLYKLTKRIAVSPYDAEETAFYSLPEAEEAPADYEEEAEGEAQEADGEEEKEE